MDKVVIKVATSSDLEDYKRIRLSALSYSPEAFGETLHDALAKTDDAWLAHINEDKVILAYADDELAGMAKLSVKDGICWLRSVFVVPYFRGRGLSDIIIASTAATAILDSQSEIRLWVYWSNTRAIDLYERNGYAVRKELASAEYPDYVVMTHTL